MNPGVTALALLLAIPSLEAAGSSRQADEPGVRVARLIEGLGTRDDARVVVGLVEIGVPAVKPLIDAMQAGGRRAGGACEALARIGSVEALEAVFDAAGADDTTLRAAGLAALRHVPSERSLLVLVAGLRSDTARAARREAAASLGQLGLDAAVPPLVVALDDKWEWVRVEAAVALGKIGGPTAAAGLVGAIRDPSWTVRLRARRSLVAIGLPAVAPLARATADPDAGLRWRAAWALGQIGGVEATAALERLRGDKDWRVRNEVAAEERRRASVPTPLYPETLAVRPALDSPVTASDGTERLVMLTAEGRWAVVDASPRDGERRERQRRTDAHDFPTLARTGLHSAAELERLSTVTGRSLAEITDLGRPGGLSDAGFMAEDEDLRGVLEGDNRLVTALGLTHPQMARPLFHVWNAVEADADAGRWNRARHRWERCRFLLYNGREVRVEAHDTKGGQESIFDDGLEGAFRIEVQRPPTSDEEAFLRRRYGHLAPERWALLVERLSTVQTGEMEPHYIQWYGFYEGHTAWRVDPLAIAFVFGLRTVEQIEAAFPGRLDGALTAHFTR